MRNKVEKLIEDWLESDNENLTYIAHEICLLLDAEVRYFKCFKCGHMIRTTNNEEVGVCLQEMSCRISGICGGSYIELTKEEFENNINNI